MRPRNALLANSRETERGAKEFLIRLAVRAARFALLSTTLILALGPAGYAQENVAVYVYPTASGITIPPDFLGLSVETLLLTGGVFPSGSSVYQQLLSQIAPGMLRIGGDSGDHIAWVGGIRNQGTPISAITGSDVGSVMALARAVGWKVLFELDLATSVASAAAAEAQYLSQNGAGLFGFEIGNEPDYYAANGDRSPSYTLTDYLAQWSAYANTVESAATGALLTGPAAAGNINTWTTQFAAQEGSRIGLLTQHWYPLGPANLVSNPAQVATIPNLLSSETHAEAATLGSGMQSIAHAAGVPWRMSETNSSFNGGQAGVSNVFASALWAVDYMFNLASHSAAGVNFHGGGNSPDAPITFGSGSLAVQPLYYALLFFRVAGQGTLIPTSVNTSGVNLNAYAALDTDGTLRVVVINEDAVQNASVQIVAGPGYAAALAMRLSAPSLQATSGISLGGAGVAGDGTWSPTQLDVVSGSAGTFTVSVPAASAVLVVFGTSSLTTTNAASGQQLVAPNSIASAYGQNLGFTTSTSPTLTPPRSLAGVSAVVSDSLGVDRPAPLFYVSPSQVNLLIPSGVAPGTAHVTIGGTSGSVQVAPVALGLFAQGGTKIAAATATRYPNGGGTPTAVPVFDCGSGTCGAVPIALNDQSTVYLSLFGTGFDTASASATTCTVDGVSVPILYIGPQNQFAGLDQVNIAVPLSLRNKGQVNVQLRIGTEVSNSVQIELGR